MMQKPFGIRSAFAALLGLIPLASAAPPFGLQIYQCTQPGVIAPGFDDGPWIYSEGILDRMEAAGFKATWFVNGNNKGNIYDYNSTLFRMISLGHQIGSHTWSHADLATLTADGVRSQMTMLEEALTNILGYFPYYMRPPYLSVNQQALSVLGDLQYHVIIGDLNTKDWEYQSESGIEIAKQLFVDGLNQGGTIVEAHEQEVWTHDDLINFMISTVVSRGIKTVTVGECLGQAPSDWYRTSRSPKPSTVSSATASSTPSLVYSTNGRCGNVGAGNNQGWTCPPIYGQKCCSKYGSCGSGSDYCAASVCQSAFGSCDPPVSTATPTPTPLGRGSITPDGTCGDAQKGNNNGYVCKTGQCCSKYGSCGNTTDYCAASVCQSAFGRCDDPISSSTSPTPSPTPLGPGSVTPDGTCGNILKGNNNGYVCKTGQCCSKYGNCGTTSDYCAASVCQSAFGHCDDPISSSSTSPASSATPTPTPLGPGSVTPDGTCGNISKGNNNGYVCKTGQCCSKYGSCGTTSDFCAASVCQSSFGRCDDPISTSSTPTPSPTPLGPGSVTPDGTCGNVQKGANKGYVCKTGQCCSKYGSCGTTTDYCAASVCQSAFGRCDGVSSSSVQNALAASTVSSKASVSSGFTTSPKPATSSGSPVSSAVGSSSVPVSSGTPNSVAAIGSSSAVVSSSAAVTSSTAATPSSSAALAGASSSSAQTSLAASSSSSAAASSSVIASSSIAASSSLSSSAVASTSAAAISSTAVEPAVVVVPASSSSVVSSFVLASPLVATSSSALTSSSEILTSSGSFTPLGSPSSSAAAVSPDYAVSSVAPAVAAPATSSAPTSSSVAPSSSEAAVVAAPVISSETPTPTPTPSSTPISSEASSFSTVSSEPAVAAAPAVLSETPTPSEPQKSSATPTLSSTSVSSEAATTSENSSSASSSSSSASPSYSSSSSSSSSADPAPTE